MIIPLLWLRMGVWDVYGSRTHLPAAPFRSPSCFVGLSNPGLSWSLCQQHQLLTCYTSALRAVSTAGVGLVQWSNVDAIKSCSHCVTFSRIMHDNQPNSNRKNYQAHTRCDLVEGAIISFSSAWRGSSFSGLEMPELMMEVLPSSVSGAGKSLDVCCVETIRLTALSTLWSGWDNWRRVHGCERIAET